MSFPPHSPTPQRKLTLSAESKRPSQFQERTTLTPPLSHRYRAHCDACHVLLIAGELSLLVEPNPQLSILSLPLPRPPVNIPSFKGLLDTDLPGLPGPSLRSSSLHFTFQLYPGHSILWHSRDMTKPSQI
ncbi:unnamed protein product [Nezara viridula]|uniref:Uncharacterized protein n=1 Tax=Nezara viridula TaxID=85310 RepID=A0A9P0GWX1_NEZVI|nr:unnamed protein product [Nezara viridula]